MSLPAPQGNRGPARAAAAPVCGSATVTLTPDADAQVSSADGGTNDGGAETMRAGNFYSTATYRAFVHFDLSNLPNGAVVQQATLRLHTYTTYGGFEYEIEVYRPQAAWVENTLTWNTQPGLVATGSRTIVDRIESSFEWSAGDTIRFDAAVFPPDAPASIVLVEALPQVVQGNLTIDGSGAGVILDGSNLPANTPGLVLASNGNSVTGLRILNVPGSGIVVQGDDNTVGGAAAQAAALAAADVAGQTIILSGRAGDPDGQPISESGFAWTSSRNGTLGTGREIVLTSLSTGAHTITLKVTDSDGLTGEASIQLFVGGLRPGGRCEPRRRGERA